MRALGLIGGCVFVIGCLGSGDGTAADAGRDAIVVVDSSVDAPVPDAPVIDGADVCGREAAAQANLLMRARAAGCGSDAECVLRGSCDQGFGFVAVPSSFAAETQALMDATECDSFDGPTYGSACEAGECVARSNGGACGSADPPLCSNGQLFYENPCGNASPSDASLGHSGCHTSCDPVTHAGCPGGLSCRATSVCSVTGASQAEGCFQCEAITVSLCLE